MEKKTKEHKSKKSGDKEKKAQIDPDLILAELKDYKDKYVRLYAEFENTQKRLEREKIEFIKYANEDLINEFLKILDDLERSVGAAFSSKDDHKALSDGIELVISNIHEMLKRNGVRVIEAKGKLFDPHCHEILMQEETDEFKESTVIEELVKGYMFNDKVIRTVKVKIAKKKDKSQIKE